MKITDVHVDYHRNGIGGEGSTLVLFRLTDHEYHKEPFMATLWGEGESGYTQCMVLQLSDLAPYVGGDWTGFKGLPGWRSTDWFLPCLNPLVSEAFEKRYAIQAAT